MVSNISVLSKMTVWKEENIGKKAGAGSITAGGWKERLRSMVKPSTVSPVLQLIIYYVDHKVCLSILLSVFFFLPSLSSVSYPSYLFSALLFFPLQPFILLSLSQFLSFLPSTLLMAASLERIFVFFVPLSRKFRESIITSCQKLTCTQLIIITYHKILTYPQLVITCHQVIAYSQLIIITCYQFLTYSHLIIITCYQVLTYSQLIIITCYQVLTYSQLIIITCYQVLTYSQLIIITWYQVLTYSQLIIITCYQALTYSQLIIITFYQVLT